MLLRQEGVTWIESRYVDYDAQIDLTYVLKYVAVQFDNYNICISLDRSHSACVRTDVLRAVFLSGFPLLTSSFFPFVLWSRKSKLLPTSAMVIAIPCQSSSHR